ncbi:DnaB-like helicase N-terminal domain-containing protein [Roseateles sp. LYH14W]|uniref:DnaB-like helicase N-terminal domain-containing protein n=1 Tax=Pelomonas parva TaxID=3299032 RepID=A0ABW7EW15_9BURK
MIVDPPAHHIDAPEQLRTPPHSDEAEYSVLGGLLIDSTAFARISDSLTAADFYSHTHRTIFTAITALIGAGKPVDVITVFDELGDTAAACGGLSYLNQVAQSVPSPANIVRYAEIVAERATLRSIIAAADVASSRAFKNEPPAELLGDLKLEFARLHEQRSLSTMVRPRTLDLRDLAAQKAPARQWFVRDWLADGPTLFAAAGGVGKTLLAQQAATCGALGRGFVGEIEQPFRSLIWACEDDAEELWRRQEAISAQLEVELDAPADNLVIQSRRGVDSVLMAPAYGALKRTPIFDELRHQVNDLRIDVLWLDNVAHLFGGDENVRGQVTAFINSMAGLVSGRQFAVVLLAHTARQAGSEFAGSAAWENAVRMRWYLGTKLPDQKGDDGEDEAADARFLCKRKANYSSRDYVRFSMRDGVLVPDQVQVGGVAGQVSQLDEKRAEELVVAGFKSLKAMGISATDGKNSPDYLPKQMAAKGLGCGYSSSELARAMNRLMGRGHFIRGPVGHYSNRNPKQGLVLQSEEMA